ncbi:MAG: phosphatase PAP2 family protein [Anaerolineae bacterium]|nr:phosphatase PAP2 family protein [Anaerolineae bacterium]
MFQIELILRLQSLASDRLTAFMNVVTTLGSDKILAAILLIIVLGVSFRRGILLIQMFMWTLLLTDGLKAAFSLPRPTFVSSHIQDLQHNNANLSPFANGGAKTFFGPIDSQTVSVFRLRGNEDFGFPSGHVSSVVALWGGMMVLFRKRILYWIAPVLIILVALSRMYLGWHFLGDVLGGALLGTAVLALAYLFLKRWGIEQKLFERTNLEFVRRTLNIPLYAMELGAPIILGILFPHALGKGAGYLVGANTALILLVLRQGAPKETASLLQRVVRVSLGFTFYFSAYGIAELILEPTGLEAIAFLDEFVKSAVMIFVSIYGAYSVGDWLTTKILNKSASITSIQ